VLQQTEIVLQRKLEPTQQIMLLLLLLLLLLPTAEL
jgi:hypothetical protein